MIVSQLIINIAMVAFFYIEQEYVTDFIIWFLKERPILYADLIRENENKYSIPFEPNLESFSLIKKMKTMKKYHYYAFHLMRETKILGWFKIQTSNFMTSVKYMEFTSKLVWGYFFFEFFFLCITEIYHFTTHTENEMIVEMKFFLSICLTLCLVAIVSYVDNCQAMVPALDGRRKLFPIIAFKISFVVLYFGLPFISTDNFQNFNELEQAAFNLNFAMVIVNLLICIKVWRTFKAFSLDWFES